MLGGQVCFMLSAASPLSANVLDFLRVCFGCIFLEAYGMTENSCAISNIDLGDNLCGNIGSPSYYKDEFHSEDVNEGKHSRTSSSKERGNDEDMIQKLAEKYMDHLGRGKSKGAAKRSKFTRTLSKQLMDFLRVLWW
ncbi:long chain acyl-CoA synthetase 7, peroxisomal [Tanacetum coccineum]|uniref:Long chain acyl-CoA synthetase 7, peroxisomal n=1 Tax=Tanacetum coccineum TaxID=301880 RepID=A0ABQ5GIP6_9ASTR